MPAMPEGSREGILKGMYKLRAADNGKAKLKAQLLGSGAILNEVLAAQKMLEKYDVAADVWSVTSYQELYRDGHACDRWNMLHPGRAAEEAVRDAVLRERAGRVRRGVRLSEGAARFDRSVDAAPDALARHRRLRPQRGSHSRCASTSRSTPASSCSPRSPSWPTPASSIARSSRRRSRTSRSIRRRESRPRPESVQRANVLDSQRAGNRSKRRGLGVGRGTLGARTGNRLTGNW